MYKTPVVINADFSYEPSNDGIKWCGNHWTYVGKKFKSLRLLKSREIYKRENALYKKLVNEIRKELIQSIINSYK